MDIEIVEFYEIERDDGKQTLSGTMHVYLVDLGIDIRGIYITKRKGFWFFSTPSRNVNNSNGDNVRYPFISFRDREKGNEFMKIIRREGQSYVENYLEINPQKIQLSDSLSIQNSEVLIKTKEWKDPSKLARNTSKFARH